MFDSGQKRYVTRAIAERLHIKLQLLLWSIIDENRDEGKELDYLQVFELTFKEDRLKIVNRQEIPERKETHSYNWAEPVNETIWVMDNKSYSTMMFPEQY